MVSPPDRRNNTPCRRSRRCRRRDGRPDCTLLGREDSRHRRRRHIAGPTSAATARMRTVRRGHSSNPRRRLRHIPVPGRRGGFRPWRWPAPISATPQRHRGDGRNSGCCVSVFPARGRPQQVYWFGGQTQACCGTDGWLLLLSLPLLLSSSSLWLACWHRQRAATMSIEGRPGQRGRSDGRNGYGQNSSGMSFGGFVLEGHSKVQR